MKVLITGAAGFIGTHLTRYCLKQGHQVVGIDSNWPRGHEFAPGYRYNVASQPITIENECFENFKPDVCFHLAAYASEGRSNHIRSFIHYNNTVGTANVINACVNHKCKLVFTSSVAVFSGADRFGDFSQPDPIDEYGLSKYMSEESIRIAAREQELQYQIVRPRNVYGPGQNLWDPSRNLFGIWMYNALHDKPCLIYGDGEQKRQFTYIDDLIPCLCNAHYLAGLDGPPAINLGSSVPYTINQAKDAFIAVTGYDKWQHVEARHEVKNAICDTGFAEKFLAWGEVEETPLRNGLKEMWKWAQIQPERPLDQMPPLEVTVNAHPSLK